MGPAHVPAMRPKNLLDLPVEIIQLCLLHTTTPTFLQAVYSCRTLYYIALECREVLMHHLNRLPGFMWGLELREVTPEHENKDLFLLLRRRACAHLYGANFCAEKTTFNFPPAENGRSGEINVPASSLAAAGGSNVVLVRRGDDDDGGCSDRVYVYGIDRQEAQIDAMIEAPYDHPGKVEVLKTLHPSWDLLCVFQRYTPITAYEEDRQEDAYTRELKGPFRQSGIHLVQYRLKIAQQPDVTFCSFPDHPDYVPLAIAVVDENLFAISWEHVNDPNSREVVMYVFDDVDSIDDVVDGITYRSCSGVVVVSSEGNVPEAIRSGHIGYQPANGSHPIPEKYSVTHLEFGDHDNQLLYFYGGFPIYGRYQNLHYSTADDLQATALFRNSCTVPFTPNVNLRFAIGIPFFGTHEYPAPGDQSGLCTWKYLALGIATHRKEGWTVACLLKSSARCWSAQCGHELYLRRGRRLGTWTAVARLWGYRRPTSSIGSIIATSAQCTRIAIANWDVIYVWALEPGELLEENIGGYYRPPYVPPREGLSSSFSSPSPTSAGGEDAERARKKSIAMKEGDGERVELRPIVLPLEAVCFKLEFVEDEEDELVALTDRGVMTWSLGPRGKGRRDRTVVLPVESEDSDGEIEDKASQTASQESNNGPARKRRHLADNYEDGDMGLDI